MTYRIHDHKCIHRVYETTRAAAIYMLGRDIRKYAIFKNDFLFYDLIKYPECTRLEKALEEFKVDDE